jgi:4-hydroxy-3-methylbut-2-en-1-yl diphosphate reductase
MSESLEIGEMFRDAVRERHGEAALPDRFRAFDTICSATQDRQDAVVALLGEQPLDLMIVIGGYNSSNTCNLARLCSDRLPTFHVADAARLVSASEIRHKPVGQNGEQTESGWLPPAGPVRIGVTAGASTPNNIVGAVIGRLAGFCDPEGS